MDTTLRWLLDRQEISDVIYRYAHSIDMRDWQAHRSCFADEIEMDFSASIGGSGLQPYHADEWVELVSPFFMRLQATQHIVTTAAPVLNGDEAFCLSLLHAQHYLPNNRGESVQRMLGHYENFLTRTPEGWKIRKCIQTIRWNEGNWHIFDLAAKQNGE